jgi:hypothetical protein
MIMMVDVWGNAYMAGAKQHGGIVPSGMIAFLL